MKLEKIEINNSEQWLFANGNESKPILLIVHGGPGNSFLPWTHEFDKLLLEDFLLIHWDQRNSGKSFKEETNKNDLTLKQFQSDLSEIVLKIYQDFSKPINLLGHSWGSLLSVTSLTKLSHIASYIGVGQVVNMKDSQLLGLDFLKDKCEESILADLGIPPFNLQNIERYGHLIT